MNIHMYHLNLLHDYIMVSQVTHIHANSLNQTFSSNFVHRHPANRLIRSSDCVFEVLFNLTLSSWVELLDIMVVTKE